ncbi:MAG: MBL fold metallo-hydrolase [Hyphomicrobiales bacterium]|nr:MBL fold metallo-hydrolase [Hyphomicrobiales bacterium]MCP5370781.1 MBL fold metallo-hydrolase [Hyphomicrobiales bacterium]
MPRPAILLFLALVLAGQAARAEPVALRVRSVADGVYALVGDLAQRSPDNLGNNATFGLVVTGAGAVLIDSGGSDRGAAQIEAAVRTVTDAPIVAVINTGGQDHRWMGNARFKAKGARIIASAAAVADQAARVDAQVQMLNALVGAAGMAGTTPRRADETFDEALDLTLGGTAIQVRHAGAAHTPGHAFVWLPAQRVLFTGDGVYMDRMLGVIEVSDLKSWIAVFEAMAALDPKVVVPGHGEPAPLAKARTETYAYLVNLRDRVRAVIAAGGGESEAVEVDQSAFAHLANFDQLARRNALAAFVQLEFE